MTFRHLLTCGALIFSALTALVAQQPKSNEFHPIGFDQLASFDYTSAEIDREKPIDPQVVALNERIPSRVRRFDGMKVSLTGFMLPTVIEGGLVKEFILMKDQQGCCYSQMPAMNGWVTVRIPSGVHEAMDVPVVVYGTIKIGPVVQEGYLAGIYEIDAVYMKR